MGYRARKLESEKRKRLLKRVLLCVLVFLFLGVCVFSFFVPIDEWKYRIKTPSVSARQEGEMRLHFLDVGQGESTIVELPDGKVMLVDGGPNDNTATKTVLRYLNALSIDTIDYLVVTHTDADHCGALKTLVQQKTILNAYLPASYESDDTTYAAFYTELAKTSCVKTTASRRVTVSTQGDNPYTFAFLYPYGTETDVPSSVLWLDYKGVSALLTGDADAETEEILLRDERLNLFSHYGVELSKTEILSVAHHGSAYSSTLPFLEYLGVKTAVVSCGKDNAYGHPSSDVLTRLQSVGATTYRTDTDGHVLITVAKDGTYKTETFVQSE